jgi:hypothetical protein
MRMDEAEREEFLYDVARDMDPYLRRDYVQGGAWKRKRGLLARAFKRWSAKRLMRIEQPRTSTSLQHGGVMVNFTGRQWKIPRPVRWQPLFVHVMLQMP